MSDAQKTACIFWMRFQDDGKGNLRNEKFKLEMTVGGPRVNQRHRCYKASSYIFLKGLDQCFFLSLMHFWGLN